MRFTIVLEASDEMLPALFEKLARDQVEAIKAYLKLRGSLVQVTTVPELEDK
jgi:hypothetical protein